ncbi:MAG: DUF3352 domain-containing protein [Candidatus Gracilibacteria bacterium]
MSRKSKSKKINANTLLQPIKKENKKSISKVKEQPKRRVSKQAIFGGVLVLIMVSLLVMVGFLLFNKAFKPASIAKIIPGENVIAVLEINSNFEHSQIIKGTELLKSHEEYSKENLLKYVENQFQISYTTDLKPWLGRSMGVVFLSSKKEEGSINKLYFAEIASQENARKFFSQGNKLSYEGHEVYALKAALYAVIIDDYVFVSSEEKDVYELVDAQKNRGNSLYASEKYRKIDDNLPINKVAFVYLDFEKINNGFIKNFPILSEKGLSIESFAPFFKIFKAEGFALIAMDNNFVIQSFLSLDAEKLENSQYITFKEKYHANLMNSVSTDTLAFWGGVNLEYQLKRMVEVFSGGNEDAMSFINALVQNYVQKYFGQDINFRQDILPLLTGEYALAVEEIDKNNIYKVLLELANPEIDSANLQKIAEKFIQSGGIFNPSIVEHTLPDGTVSKEIIAVPEEVQKIDSTYKNIVIHGLKIGEREWGIYYAIVGNVAVIATHIDGVKSTIDIANGEKNSLESTAVFDYQIAPILENSDEVTYFNLRKLYPLLLDENSLNEYLKPIDSFSSGKNYFNDGIVTINYLHID